MNPCTLYDAAVRARLAVQPFANELVRIPSLADIEARVMDALVDAAPYAIPFYERGGWYFKGADRMWRGPHPTRADALLAPAKGE